MRFVDDGDIQLSADPLSFSAVFIIIISSSITQGPDIRKSSSAPQVISPIYYLFLAHNVLKA